MPTGFTDKYTGKRKQREKQLFGGKTTAAADDGHAPSEPDERRKRGVTAMQQRGGLIELEKQSTKAGFDR